MANPTHLTLMVYTDAFILYEYHGNIAIWVWWWSGGVNDDMQLALQRTERLDYVFAEVRSFSIFFKN